MKAKNTGLQRYFQEISEGNFESSTICARDVTRHDIHSQFLHLRGRWVVVAMITAVCDPLLKLFLWLQGSEPWRATVFSQRPIFVLRFPNLKLSQSKLSSLLCRAQSLFCFLCFLMFVCGYMLKNHGLYTVQAKCLHITRLRLTRLIPVSLIYFRLEGKMEIIMSYINMRFILMSLYN